MFFGGADGLEGRGRALCIGLKEAWSVFDYGGLLGFCGTGKTLFQMGGVGFEGAARGDGTMGAGRFLIIIFGSSLSSSFFYVFLGGCFSMIDTCWQNIGKFGNVVKCTAAWRLIRDTSSGRSARFCSASYCALLFCSTEVRGEGSKNVVTIYPEFSLSLALSRQSIEGEHWFEGKEKRYFLEIFYDFSFGIVRWRDPDICRSQWILPRAIKKFTKFSRKSKKYIIIALGKYRVFL